MTAAATMTGGGATVAPCGDQAFLVRLGTQIDPAVNARAQVLAARVRADAPAWLVDCVPSYAAVLIQFDLVATDAATVLSFVQRHLATLNAEDAAPAAATATANRQLEIPVCYAPTFALDLGDLATASGLSVEDVIQRHAAVEYQVYLLGFRPGFPFLGLVDETIAAPRLPTPRARVPAGAVGIAGRQTGIYPTAGPGGWRIVGRTPWRLFDPASASPFRVAAGDRVRFVPIDAETFTRLQENDDVD
ncbi:MAG TPA: 5-oxoprolinase subunit PxpB [Polyangia bacterium]|jgi:KipI family sensor histidine kinase inhibitor